MAVEYGTGAKIELKFPVYKPVAIPHANSPEPLGFMERMADAQPKPPQPFCDFARALRSHNWTATIGQLAEDTKQDVRDVRKTATLLPGVLRLERVPGPNQIEEIISLDMQLAK